jgi:hypothetical protein
MDPMDHLFSGLTTGSSSADGESESPPPQVVPNSTSTTSWPFDSGNAAAGVSNVLDVPVVPVPVVVMMDADGVGVNSRASGGTGKKDNQQCKEEDTKFLK